MNGSRSSGDRINGSKAPGERMNGLKAIGERIAVESATGDRIVGERRRGERIPGAIIHGLRMTVPNMDGHKMTGASATGDRISGCDTATGFRINDVKIIGDKIIPSPGCRFALTGLPSALASSRRFISIRRRISASLSDLNSSRAAESL